MRFEEILTVWLPRQRWFAEKGRAIRDLAVVADTKLVAGDPELRHLVIAVAQDGTVDRYQVLAGVRATLHDWLRHAMIGSGTRPDGSSAVIYDAAHDNELTKILLTAIAAGQDRGRLRFRKSPGATLNTNLDSLVLTGEQSNTSLVYGEEAILKLFRRLTPGANPDLEVTSALARIGSAHIAQPFGGIEMELDGQPTTPASLSEYLRAAGGGVSRAHTSARGRSAGAGVAS